MAPADEQPNELARLVGGDAARYSEEDAGHGDILAVCGALP